MTDISIHAEDLGKQYRIGGKPQGYKTFRESISSLAHLPSRLMRSRNGRPQRKNASDNLIWALRDISFDIKQGDVVGIIGRNGAGKSTLLKILSRITEPTTGFADIRGRVGSLLEVGTGFHPELTGRENIFLNGAILGMGRAEILRKFDEIVDFSGVERFIDTPVKRYSSGMYLRLAFAVAAHLEPEILLVDEVLAVGDASFQKKCLGRMEAVAQEGRTVLFVSHNMGAIRSLCDSGMVLNDGTIDTIGGVNECITRYFQTIGVLKADDDEVDQVEDSRTGFGRVSLIGHSNNTIHQSEGFEAAATFRLRSNASGFYLFCILEDMSGATIFHMQEASTDLGMKDITAGDYHFRVKFPPLWLVPGLYSLHFKIMLWGAEGSKVLSDKFPLDIEGESSSAKTACLLHPRGEWTIDTPDRISIKSEEITL